jgi:PAS domain S-box-containing protein
LPVVPDTETKNTEHILTRWDEENYRLLAENSTDLIVRISIEGICLYVSPACTELLGYTPEEVTGRRVFDFIHPLDRRVVADSLESEVLFRSHKKIICRLRRKDGYYGWFESKFQFFNDAITKELQVVAISRDIGDRIRAERFSTVRHTIAALKPSEADLEKDFASLLETICTTLTWDLGEIWLVDDATSRLKLCSHWCGPSPRLRRFSTTSSRMAFAPGVGLPGSLWSRGGVTIIDDLPAMYSTIRRREYEEAGLKAAIGTVLADESRTYGVIVFISRRSIQHNQELLNMIEETGFELGTFIAKFRIRESLRAESEKLGTLVEESTARIRELQSEINRQQRIEQDILMAAEVQRNLLPVGTPVLPGFDFSFAAMPARYISGDFYDFAMPSSSLCDIIIADVSGKGISAAMMTTAARAFFRHDDTADIAPAALLGAMNEALFADLDHTEMFLTAQLIRIDAERGIITYASAGHTEAVRFNPSSGEYDCFPSTAPPIGILRGIDIGEIEIRTRPGDYFVIYSDGVTEASDENGALFGMKRFVQTLRSRRFISPADLVQTILAEVRSFSGDRPLADDLTLIAIGATSREHRLRVGAEMNNLDPTVAFVRDVVLPYGAKIADNMELVASELITNAIQHGITAATETQNNTHGMDMDVSLRLEPGRIAFDLVYPGPSFNPDTGTRPLPDPLQEGGRGIHIVRALVDELEYSSTPMNHWHVVKRVSAEGSI